MRKPVFRQGIETEIFQAGDPSIENVKAAAKIMEESDALVVGSPVYWASPSGQIIEFRVKKVGDAPDIVKDDITNVTLFDYSDIISGEHEELDE